MIPKNMPIVFDPDTIKTIRERYLQGDTQLNLANDFDTTQKTISLIVAMKTYKEYGVPNDYQVRYRMRTGRTIKDSK